MSGGLRIAFAGTPDLAAVILDKLLQARRHSVNHVFTQPDRRAGRGRKPVPSPVKVLAETHDLPLSQPSSAAELEQHEALTAADVLAVAAFGMILPESVINLPRHGSINVHTSLLPRWRGAAPIQRAIEAGDRDTGITIMQMDAGLDTGDILLQRRCPIHDDDTADSVHDRLAVLGAECLAEVLDLMAAGRLEPVPQNDDLATYARKITKAEAEIDWSLPAETIERKIRAFNPSPIAHTCINGQAIRVWQAAPLSVPSDARPGTVVGYSPLGLDIATASGPLRILRLQLPGKKVCSAKEFYNGHPDFLRQ